MFVFVVPIYWGNSQFISIYASCWWMFFEEAVIKNEMMHIKKEMIINPTTMMCQRQIKKIIQIMEIMPPSE